MSHSARPSSASERCVTAGSTRRWLAAGAVALVALAVRLPLMSGAGFGPDQDEFFVWSHRAAAGEMADVYRASPTYRASNYPPAYIYALRGLATVFRWKTGRVLDDSVRFEVYQGRPTQAARVAVSLFKWPAVMADALLGAVLVLWLWRRLRPVGAVAVSCAYVLLPSVIHNSSVWGQVDAVPTLFVIASLEAARRRRPAAMSALAALAMLTKVQAVVFLPLWLAIGLFYTVHRRRRRLAVAGAALGVALLVSAPFLGDVSGVASAYSAAADRYPHTHLNGFSAWFLSHPLDRPRLESMRTSYARDDSPLVFGLTPRSLGISAFGLVCIGVWLVLRRRRCDTASISWAARILPLAFFVLSTQMHERYLFQAVAVWAWSATATRRWWAAWLVLGGCAFANVMWVWPGPAGEAFIGAVRDILWVRWVWFWPGAWCALLLIAVLMLSGCGWVDRFRPWAARRAGSAAGSGATGTDGEARGSGN